MAIYKRVDVEKAFQSIKKGKTAQVYLIAGDRFFCRQVADKLIDTLFAEQSQLNHNLTVVDGEKEEPIVTLNRLKTYSMFPGRQVIKVLDSQLLAKDIAKSTKPQVTEDEKKTAPLTSRGTAADDYMAAFESGIPENNILVLLAEDIDKRKKFFKFINTKGIVFDLSVESGASKSAREEQANVLRGLISETLNDFAKTIEPRALPVLLERVGFYPVAVVRETEKLALYVEERRSITLADVDAMIGRTREDALYELTEAYDNGEIQKSLVISARLLESGLHPLVIVAGLRNHLRRLLLVCSFRMQSEPVFVDGMSFAAFQKGYLAQLKIAKADLLQTFPRHPYALYMMFTKARKSSARDLLSALKKLLEVEFCLKSSPLTGQVVLEGFFFTTL